MGHRRMHGDGPKASVSVDEHKTQGDGCESLGECVVNTYSIYRA